MSIPKLFLFLILVISATSCQQNSTKNDPIHPGDDPNFTIVSNDNQELHAFNRKVVVFGIPIYAVSKVQDAKLLHAANVLAQYLDNNEDGTVDNSLVLDAMLSNHAFMVMWKNDSDLDEIEPPDYAIGQDLGDDETNPNFVSSNNKGDFDAALEEVWHIISHAGYAYAYPSIFGENEGTQLTQAMDLARGGQFIQIPTPYPSQAWYTYDDATCTYDCMAAEYFYWGLTSILGAQKNRPHEIGNEWRLHTRELVASKDTSLYKLLTDPKYQLPSQLPDGSYKR